MTFKCLFTLSRIREEMKSGVEYWSLERKLCHPLGSKHEVLIHYAEQVEQILTSCLNYHHFLINIYYGTVFLNLITPMCWPLGVTKLWSIHYLIYGVKGVLKMKHMQYTNSRAGSVLYKIFDAFKHNVSKVRSTILYDPRLVILWDRYCLDKWIRKWSRYLFTCGEVYKISFS